MNENEIRSLFQTHKVPLSREDVWKVQSTPVIKHSALERLSAALKITWDMPQLVRYERDEAVVLARGIRQDGIAEWSFGEALITQDGQIGGNYKVSGKQASYVYAMAEKRAKDRVIIKLAGLHGAYSEEEADDFKVKENKTFSEAEGNADRGQQESQQTQQQQPAPTDKPDNVVPIKGDANSSNELTAEALKAKLDKADDVQKVTNLMLDKSTQELLKTLNGTGQEELRNYAKQRLVDLGWTARKQQAAQG